MNRLVVVSNRVWDPAGRQAPGGLAAGLQATMRARPGLWFGWSSRTQECPTDAGATIAHVDGVTYASISYDDVEYRDFYLGFCNSTLWPLLHSVTADLPYSESQHQAYQRMNRRYARELAPLLQPDDLVWVHDYHLLALARELRAIGFQQPLGLFLHTPFPPPEMLRQLPGHREVLSEMLAYDVVGFQTAADQGAFHRAAGHLLGATTSAGPDALTLHGRVITTGVFPIGVDVDAIQADAVSTMNSDTIMRSIAGTQGRRLLLGIDRLDYTKGITERVRAYDRFLQTHPDYRNRVTFLQIAAPSRTEVPAYAEVGRTLGHAVRTTNGRFGQTGWAPIRYLNRVMDRTVLLGLMRCADVGLVTPLRDGMNLVAKEYLAAQNPADPGVLILSRFAGSAQELTSAILVDPHDDAGTAAAIRNALTLSLAERKERHQAMLDVLRRNSINAWHTRFIAALEAVPGRGSRQHAKVV